MKLTKENFQGFKQYPEKVLQFGEGNFLRAFVDWMIDEMNKKTDFNGSALVIQPLENGLVNILNEQDGLYTLYLNGIKAGEVVSEHSVINSISRGLNLYQEYDQYLKAAENPSLRFIISNTTEAGITFDERDHLGDRPQSSFPGKLAAFLFERFKFFKGDLSKGFIFIPCELIDKNGEKLKETVLQYAKLWSLGEDFENWVNHANIFCNSLVDRIVPGYPKDKMEEITKELGYQDNLVVEAEQFHLWVIEGPAKIKDEFPADKASLNVLFVDDMAPYRTRKVRILNGAHTSMVPVAYLSRLDTVKEAVEDEAVGNFVKETIFEEIIPTLDLAADQLESFANDVLDRFRNPFIKHYLSSIALNSMSKFETRVLPSIIQYHERTGKLPRRLVFSLASLIAFYKGKRNNEDIKLQDDETVLELYKNLWKAYDGTEAGLKKLVTEVLAFEKIWKTDLNELPGLTDLITSYLTKIERAGMVEALKEV
ncbi:MAG: tagaturonate reductase [Bacillota bacterium]|nr:tagaturonate reductase [Bacillota bacterium]